MKKLANLYTLGELVPLGINPNNSMKWKYIKISKPTYFYLAKGKTIHPVIFTRNLRIKFDSLFTLLTQLLGLIDPILQVSGIHYAQTFHQNMISHPQLLQQPSPTHLLYFCKNYLK